MGCVKRISFGDCHNTQAKVPKVNNNNISNSVVGCRGDPVIVPAGDWVLPIREAFCVSWKCLKTNNNAATHS